LSSRFVGCILPSVGNASPIVNYIPPIVNHIPPIVVENEKTQDVEISLDKGIIIKYILNSQKDRCRYTIA